MEPPMDIDRPALSAVASLSEIEGAALLVEEWREQVRIVLERCFDLDQIEAARQELAFFQTIENAEVGNQAPEFKLAVLHASPFQIAASLAGPFNISAAATRYSELVASSGMPDGRVPPPHRGGSARRAA